MIYYFLFFELLAVLFSPLLCKEGEGGGRNDPLQTLRKTFEKASGFEVRFTQELKQNVLLARSEKAEGRVQFHRPHQMKWVYEKPEKREMVWDGKRLRIEEAGEVQIFHSQDMLTLEESFSFLWGELRPKTFDIQFLDAHRFRIVPRNLKKAAFQFIEIWVESGYVKSALVKDPLDGESHLSFFKWKLF